MTKKRLIFALLTTFQLGFLCLSCWAQSQEEKLKVAIIPHRSNLGNEQAYSSFFKELEKETGISFEWLGSKTYDDVIEKITSQKADVGYVGPFSYVDAQDNYGVRLLCRTLNKKKEAFYHSMIFTGKDSAINSLEDLKGKRFSFTDPKSTSGYLFPMAQLKEAGVQLEDFSEVKYLKRHANSLIAVYKGHVDAGASSSTAFDKVDIKDEDVKILWKSEPIYRGPWITRKNLPDSQFFKIQKAMLKISQSDEADQIFQELSTKGFVEAKDSDYNNVRSVIRLMGAPK